jgi:hypothetical protein
MNIQDEMQKIHHKFGVSEMANYKIEQFIENLIKEDRAKQLIITDVSQRSELLAFLMWYDEKMYHNSNKETALQLIDEYKANCG